MTFIAKIIKKTIELTDPLVGQTPITIAQKQVLKKLLEKAKEKVTEATSDTWDETKIWIESKFKEVEGFFSN